MPAPVRVLRPHVLVARLWLAGWLAEQPGGSHPLIVRGWRGSRPGWTDGRWIDSGLDAERTALCHTLFGAGSAPNALSLGVAGGRALACSAPTLPPVITSILSLFALEPTSQVLVAHPPSRLGPAAYVSHSHPPPRLSCYLPSSLAVVTTFTTV